MTTACFLVSHNVIQCRLCTKLQEAKPINTPVKLLSAEEKENCRQNLKSAMTQPTVSLVEIVIVDISKQVNDDDKAATNLTEYLDQDVFQRLNSVSAADGLLDLESLDRDDKETAAKLRKSIVRFVQTKDRWTALSSLLLKRQALFQAIHHEDQKNPPNNTNGKLCPPSFPLIDLPRTKHKKPYIPKIGPRQFQNKEWFPFSISHQYPFVGMASPGPNRFDDSLVYGMLPFTLGFDIVVFDDYNRRLHNTVTDFVNVFIKSFASSEQAILNRLINKPRNAEGDLHLLRELYLMWSVKEAYTKALGVGMGFDFSRFATSFHNFDPEQDTLWEVLSSSLPTEEDGKKTTMVRPATISFADSRPEETWMFGFLFLWDDDINRPDCSHHPLTRAPRGCACVCWGPSSSQDTEITVDFRKVKELVNG